jgi:hypothetical protein
MNAASICNLFPQLGSVIFILSPFQDFSDHLFISKDEDECPYSTTSGEIRKIVHIFQLFLPTLTHWNTLQFTRNLSFISHDSYP